MDTEASSFETSEVLASFLASTPLLSDSWSLCHHANANSPQIFVTQQIGSIGYLAFSGIPSVSVSHPCCSTDLVPLESAGNGLFSPLLRQHEGEDPVLVNAGLLHIFLNVYGNPSFRNQVSALMATSKSIVITGHSIGGTTASLTALWLLSSLQSTFSSISVLCITFGSPFLGNESLSRAILRERWGGSFCHLVSKYDIMPRLLFAPLPDITPQINSLLQIWNLSMASPDFAVLAAMQLHDEIKAAIFGFVLRHLEKSAESGEGRMPTSFWPFGNYFFCSEKGAICVDNATSVIKMMHLLFMTGTPSRSIEDHLKYGDYVKKVSSQFLEKKCFMQGEIPESTYVAGVQLALESAGIASQEPVAIPATDCLKAARRLGRTPNLNCANLAVKLSQITPYRAEIQWYKDLCDRSDDQMGYYDSFKHRGTSKRGFKVNMNRHKLARFWDNVISMLENNQLPHDFHRRAKWVNAPQFYMLLVEPLDIAEYYRTGMHRIKGHYISNGRERRYQIFDRWWKERKVEEELNQRSKFASLTQDTCFWAKVEEAREWLDNVRTESDPSNLVLLWEKIDEFERYASKLVERKEVSIDVVAKNSSYIMWVNDYKELKSRMAQPRPQFPSFIDGVVP